MDVLFVYVDALFNSISYYMYAYSLPTLWSMKTNVQKLEVFYR